MVSFCSYGSDPVRQSRRPFWQPACPFLASGDHFWPCQGPAPTGAAAVSPGRPTAAAGVMPWARGLAFLSRRPIWRLAHKKMLSTWRGPGARRGPGAQQKFIAHKITFHKLRPVRLEPMSAPCQKESSTAELGALHMKFCCEFVLCDLSGLPAAATEMLPWARDYVKTSSQFFWALCGI